MKKIWIYRSSLMLTLGASLAAVIQIWLRIANINGSADVFDRVDQALLLLLVLFSVGTTWGVIQSWRKKEYPGFAARFLQNRLLYWGLLIFLGLILLESVQDLLYLEAGLKEVYYPVTLVRNRGLLVWAAFVSGQSILAWLVVGWVEGFIKPSKLREIPAWLVVGLILGGGILVLGGGGTQPTNAPLPALHVFLVVGGMIGSGFLLRWLSQRIPGLGNILRWEILALVILWAAAFALWSNVPLQSNYFLEAPRPPNQQFRPTSDSIYYEIQAHRLLAGEGLEDKTQHPLYGYLLAGLHVLGGEHYLDIYRLQIALLAFTPFIIYKLAKLLHSRFAGWLLAALFIIREFNALHLGDSITVSNVQVLMTEPTALLGVALFLYLTVLWLKEQEQDLGLPFLIGGVIGLTALVRVELLSMGLVFGLLLVVRYRQKWRRWLIPGALAFMALALTVGPWMIRNYQRTGVLSLDKADVIQKTFNLDKVGNNEEQSTPALGILENMRKEFDQFPAKARRTSGHIISSLKQTILYFPSNYFPLGGADSFVNIVPEKDKVFFFQSGIFSDNYLTRYTKSLPYWNLRWKGNLALRSIIPVLINVFLITLGLKESWRREGWIGWIPLGMMAAHVCTYAFFNFSGGRFIQVVDWITLIYFSFGVIQVLDWMLPNQDFAQVTGKDRNKTKNSTGIASAVGVGLILIGLALPLIESRIPKLYSRKRLENILSENPLLRSGSDPESEVLIGRALYPGFYRVDEFFEDDRQGRMPDSGRNQLVFYLVGTKSIWVSFPTDQNGTAIPHGSELILQGRVIRDSEEFLAERLLPYFEADYFGFVLDQDSK